MAPTGEKQIQSPKDTLKTCLSTPPQKKTGPKMHGCSAVGPPCPVYGHLIVSLELALLQLPRVHAEPLEHAQKQGTLLGAPVQNLIEDKESFRSLPLAQ